MGICASHCFSKDNVDMNKDSINEIENMNLKEISSKVDMKEFVLKQISIKKEDQNIDNIIADDEEIDMEYYSKPEVVSRIADIQNKWKRKRESNGKPQELKNNLNKKTSGSYDKTTTMDDSNKKWLLDKILLFYEFYIFIKAFRSITGLSEPKDSTNFNNVPIPEKKNSSKSEISIPLDDSSLIVEAAIEDLKSKIISNDFEKVKMTLENTKQRYMLPEITFQDGNLYKGQWKCAMKDGFGIQTWPDGSKYDVY